MIFLATLVALLASCGHANDPIIIKTPERPAGQEDVIGLGMGGELAVYRFTHIPEAKVVAISDLYADRIELSKISIENGNRPVEVPDFTRVAWNKVQGYRHAFAK